ncbi:MAG TPA: TonB-dependent receptor [Steroidobacteraceae bacterium]|jgi:iron complex outermembrane receptor protein
MNSNTDVAHSLRHWTAVLCGVGLAAFAMSAPAQQAQSGAAAGEESGALAEVVVTAERREENIQNVPITVDAFSADVMQTRNITDIKALGNLTPGVNLDAGAPFSGDRSVLSASIRGVGQDDFAFNLNPGVGVYVDGVFLARTIGANQNLLDVDRVEILKGPQGTLFGANTIGGAISITTHTPGDDTRFIATATGGSYDRRDFGFTADIPIIKGTLLSSISVSSQDQTGWMKVVPYPANSPYSLASMTVIPMSDFAQSGLGTSDTYGGTGLQVIRGKLVWHASDKMDWTMAADWSHEDTTALGYTVLQTFAGNVASSPFASLYNLCISNNASTISQAIAAGTNPPNVIFPVGVPPNIFFSGVCAQPRAQVPGISRGAPPLLGAGYVGGPAGPYNYLNHPGTTYLGSASPYPWWGPEAVNTGNINTTYAADGPDFARYNVYGDALTGTYNLTDTLTLKSITAYRTISWQIGTSLQGSPGDGMQSVTDKQHQWQVSQEFQLLGKMFDDRLNYVAGLYYFNEAGYVHDYVPFEGLLYVYDADNDIENKDIAAFIHGDFKLTKQISFTAGGRYTDVGTYFKGGQGDLNSFPYGSQCWQTACAPFPAFNTVPSQPYPPGPGTGVEGALGQAYYRYFPPVPDSQAWHVFDPTLGAQFHFNDDVMAYVSWSKGFKQGGWTTRLSAPILTPQAARFSPEYSKTYELGLKSQWFNHRLQANAAVFYTNYDGIQLNIQQGISPVYTNAGNANIKGAELDVQSNVGGGLSLNFSGSYIDAYYTQVNADANIPQILLPDGTAECPTFVINGATGAPVCPLHAPGVTQLDAKLPKTPKWKFTFDPTYDLHLANDAILRFIPTYTYTSNMFNDALNTPQLYRPATHMVDASVHYVSPTGMYDLAFGGTNLTDDRFITAGSPNAGAGEVGGYYNDPREWYVTLRLKL